MTEGLELIDELPSAKLFLDGRGDRLLQLFSGEGESLILALWLSKHNISPDGLFVVTPYGKSWGIDRIALRRWRMIYRKSKISILQITVDNPSAAVDFTHQYTIEEETVTYSNCALDWAEKHQYQDIVMGLRREDLKRIKDSKIEEAVDREVRRSGKALSKFNIWWPLYEMTGKQKKRLSRHTKGIEAGSLI